MDAKQTSKRVSSVGPTAPDGAHRITDGIGGKRGPLEGVVGSWSRTPRAPRITHHAVKLDSAGHRPSSIANLA